MCKVFLAVSFNLSNLTSPIIAQYDEIEKKIFFVRHPLYMDKLRHKLKQFSFFLFCLALTKNSFFYQMKNITKSVF